MGKIKELTLSKKKRKKLEKEFRYGKCHRVRARCQAVLLKAKNFSVAEIANIVDYKELTVYTWIRKYRSEGIDGLLEKGGRGPKKLMTDADRESVRNAVVNNRDSIKTAKCAWETENGKEVSDATFRRFIKNMGGRFKRIRLRPRGQSLPQLIEHKRILLLELVELWKQGVIDLFFGDQSHVCTSGYVPYGWQFDDEDVFIPAKKEDRLNIFGMISPDNKYEGFDTTESITSEMMEAYFDMLVKTITKKTVVVLDNASVNRKGEVRKKIDEWKAKGLYIFYLPPYCPHLNIAETVWRFLKGKWLKPEHYLSRTRLHEATRKILSEIGTTYNINFAQAA